MTKAISVKGLLSQQWGRRLVSPHPEGPESQLGRGSPRLGKQQPLHLGTTANPNPVGCPVVQTCMTFPITSFPSPPLSSLLLKAVLPQDLCTGRSFTWTPHPDICKDFVPSPASDVTSSVTFTHATCLKLQLPTRFLTFRSADGFRTLCNFLIYCACLFIVCLPDQDPSAQGICYLVCFRMPGA